MLERPHGRPRRVFARIAPLELLTFRNPVFATYAAAASIMILKSLAMSWLTVIRMMQAKGGFRAPEDLRRTRLNPAPAPHQLAPNEAVERMRRIQLNDLESVPYFLAAGLIYVLTEPRLIVAQCLIYGYVLTRLAHFIAYLTAQTHDVRALLWTPGSLIVIYLAIASLGSAFRALL